MSSSPIRILLEQVARTGVIPADDELTPLFTRGTRNERAAARAGVRIASKRIAARLSEGDDGTLQDDLAEIIEDAEAKFAATVKAPKEAADPMDRGRRDAEAIRADRGAEDRDERLARARLAKERREPLEVLLRQAGPGRGLSPYAFGGLKLRGDLSADEAEKWRSEVQKVGDKVAEIHASGNHGYSREYATEQAHRLADALALPPGPADPNRPDLVDGRALADAIRNRD